MEYSETFHLKFSCHFDFTDYPFDSHECFMHYGSYDTDSSEVTLTPPTISYRKSVTRNGDNPMNLKGQISIVQDFLIKLGIKPRLHILKISIFSPCHCHTYQNYEQPPQNLYFQSHFSASKINQIFLNFFFCEEFLTRRSSFIYKIF